MPAPDIELWAVCDTCSRAFFVSSHADDVPADVSCPVCAEVPARLERRSDGSVVDVRTLAPQALL